MTTNRAPRQHPASTPRVVEQLREDMHGLRKRLVERIRGEVPLYELGEVVSPQQLRASVEDALDYVLDRLGRDAPDDLRAPESLGRTRAEQGAPLVDMVSGCRVFFAEFWLALREAAGRLATVPESDLVELAGLVFSLHNAYSDVAINAYRKESQQILRTRERERAVLVEAILSGEAALGTVWEVAQALRLPLNGTFLIVVAESSELGHDPMPRVESALAVLDVTSVWRLEAGESLGVLSLPERVKATAVLTMLRRHATGRVGVSPAVSDLRHAARALRLARNAVATCPRPVGVEQFRDRLLDVLLAGTPTSADELASVVLGPVLELPAQERDSLIVTLQTWLEKEGSATAAGAVLFCHPNTVRYRLRRVESLTGRSLGKPEELAELFMAVRAWAQRPGLDAP